MCGIGGILRVWPAERRAEALATPHVHSIPEAWLDTIDESIKHRGPDGRGRFRDRAMRADGCVIDVALVHRRLSIIDHAGGHQPMLSLGRGMGVVGGKRLVLGGGLGLYERDAASELVGDGPGIDALIGAPRVSERREPDASGPPHLSLAREAPSDRVCVVFNGCIYNHRELRAELQRAGQVFSSDHSDTEVLVHGWREWGHGLWDRLDGMFAAVIWDQVVGRIAYAKDSFGEKPLYTRQTEPGTLALASCPPGVMGLPPAWTATADDIDYMTRPWIKFGWNQMPTPPGLDEAFHGSAREFPGDIQHDGFAGLWREAVRPGSERLLPEQLDQELQAAIHSRLESDVPMGCFLSGGIDSALIAAIAAKAKPDLRTYTVRMPDRRLDESEAASLMARALGVRHSVLDCQPTPCEDIVSMVGELGLPFGDSSMLPARWVSRAAGREVKVALSGDGGDELFLGYDRHRAMKWLAMLCRLPDDVRSHLADASGPPGSPSRRFDRLARLLGATRAGGYKELVAIFPNPLDSEISLRPGAGGIHYGYTPPGSDDEHLAWCLRFDRMFYLPLDLMRKTDTASMSVPLEVRAPLLRPSLARTAMSASIESLMPGNQRKGLLRQVARKYLPAEIVDRPKQGFAIPIGEWFRSDYGGLRTMLLDHLNSTEPFRPPGLGIDLNMKYVRQMLDEHLGTGPSGRVVRDHSQRLYMLLVLSVWAKWLGGVGK